MVNQNPDLIRVQNILPEYEVVTSDSEINTVRNKLNIKQQYNYLFYKIQDSHVVSIYGSYGHDDVSEVYHVWGTKI